MISADGRSPDAPTLGAFGVAVLLAAAQGSERLQLRGGIGAVLALSGILWMTFGPQPVAVPLGALAAMLAAALAVGFVLFPVATMALEAWILGTPVTLQAVTGAGMVMAGVWFGALSPGARRAAAGPPEVRPVGPDPAIVAADADEL